MVKKVFTEDEPVSVRVRRQVNGISEEELEPTSEVEAREEQESVSESESESDSEDEAPEEEGVNDALKQAEQLEQERREKELKLKLLEKLKRRELNLKFQKQQEEKRLKLESIKAAARAEEDDDDDEEMPDFLPEELLEGSFDTTLKPKTASTHINFDQDPKEIRKQLKKQRLQQLKQLKKLTTKSVKKGPVTVLVLGQRKGLSVPVAESKIVNKRDKWLKRKSLAKQRV